MPSTVNTGSARDLLRTLVETPSLSGDEAAASAELVEFLEAHDRSAFTDDIGNVRAPGDDGVLLTSHIDTVPGAIPVRIEDGELWGRGSVDAKGSLAALAVAAVETGASFVAVVGEEADSRGARQLIAERKPPDAVINGEPSGWDAVTLGYRGMLAGTYLATSESGHSSRPTPNAIEDAMGWWARVQAAFEADEWTPVFEQVTTKPIAVDGGPSDDGLSVEATMDVQLRVPPDEGVDAVREVADGELETGTVRWADAIPPVVQSARTEPARRFRAAIRTHDGEPRQLRKTGTSDMNLYADAWDCPMVSYGPGDSSLDHAPTERLSLAAFDRSVSVLTDVASGLVRE